MMAKGALAVLSPHFGRARISGQGYARPGCRKEVSMIIIQSGHLFLVNAAPSWSADWAWGLPLIVLTVLTHVFGLSLIRERAVRAFNQIGQRHHPIGVPGCPDSACCSASIDSVLMVLMDNCSSSSLLMFIVPLVFQRHQP
jgi:hypothetical protein